MTSLLLECEDCGFKGRLEIECDKGIVRQNADFYRCPWCGGGDGKLVLGIK